MVTGGDTCIYDIDKQLSASVKKILLQRIVFKDAMMPDEGDIMNLKYKPINVGYKPGKIQMSKQHGKDLAMCNELPKPLVVLYPQDRVEIGWKDIRRVGPGLANLGNTCFLNSVLQVLTYTPPLVNYVLSDYHKNKCKQLFIIFYYFLLI